jgi:hypothetical protein
MRAIVAISGYKADPGNDIYRSGKPLRHPKQAGIMFFFEEIFYG